MQLELGKQYLFPKHVSRFVREGGKISGEQIHFKLPEIDIEKTKEVVEADLESIVFIY